ncbi:FadR/GntR family transcriptional regulator [Mumia sp. DW29H23]|uniref:FadR/GntR family transcriptional regulator n=1 Tax=Mumia sp. DW29H23 TaxID=3421241 RepID=UPI003D69597A
MAGTGREPRAVSAVPQPQRLNTTSVAEAVASQLRSRILDGDLVDGSELPPEAALLEQFPVSRPSLREAFRILETEGLVTVRRGKRGGTVITHPAPAGAAYHVGLLLHSRHTSLADLAAARNLVEPLTAEQAARRRNHRKIGRELSALTREAEEHLEDELLFTQLSTQFHHDLVMAAGNETLQILVGVLEGIWNTQELTWAASAVDEGEYPAIGLRRDVVRAHLRISEAIEQGDAENALRLTRAHLKATSGFVASSGGRVRVLDEHGSRRQVPIRVATRG